jgi:hypothetical protein
MTREPSGTQAREVILYTRKNCGLCDETLEDLRALAPELNLTIRAVEIDGDDALRARYNDIIPVVTLDGREVARAPIDPDDLRAALAAVVGA